MASERTIGAAEVLAAVAAGAGGIRKPPSTAVLVPIVDGPDGAEVLLEVRARTLDEQPGEVSLPGGHVEPLETPQAAAVRETCEELLVEPGAVTGVEPLAVTQGPGARALASFVGRLEGYAGTFSTDEVERTFRIPVSWLLAHDPEVHHVGLAPVFGDDFPFDLVPGGRAYPWRWGSLDIPFWRGTDPLVWGATARVLMAFVAAVRSGLPDDADDGLNR